jgi:hypothetical protein
LARAVAEPGTRPEAVTLAALAPGTGPAEPCAVPAHLVGSQRARDTLSTDEWIESRVVIASDGHVIVATRLSSRLSRPLRVQVTVSFLTGAGAELAMVGRSYRLAGRSAEASTTPGVRARAGAVMLRLDAAALCRLARVSISQCRLGGSWPL